MGSCWAFNSEGTQWAHSQHKHHGPGVSQRPLWSGLFDTVIGQVWEVVTVGRVTFSLSSLSDDFDCQVSSACRRVWWYYYNALQYDEPTRYGEICRHRENTEKEITAPCWRSDSFKSKERYLSGRRHPSLSLPCVSWGSRLRKMDVPPADRKHVLHHRDWNWSQNIRKTQRTNVPWLKLDRQVWKTDPWMDSYYFISDRWQQREEVAREDLTMNATSALNSKVLLDSVLLVSTSGAFLLSEPEI